MAKNGILIVLSVILGVLFLVAAYTYFANQAGHLPTYFPGYSSGSTTVHTKHGIAAVILGLACFIYAWFAGGPKEGLADQQDQGE